MHITILQVLHPPFDKRVFHKEALSLVKAGHEVLSITPHDGPLADEQGVRFLPMPEAHSLPQRLLATLRLVRVGRKVETDVYFCMEPESWVSGLILKLLTGRKVVFDVHEYVPTEFAKFFPRVLFPFVVWLTIRMMRLFARATDHIILTKECLDRDFKGLATPRTVVLNTNRAQPPCTEIAQDLRERYAGKATIIHQGQFGDVRGSYQLLDAMKLVLEETPDAQCILLGSYVQGDEAAYRRAISEAGLDEAIHMLGVVPFDEVAQYIAVSKVGLILFQPIGLGHTLGMPHKMFDYMREGVPFIAPDFVVEIKRIVEEGDCGFLVDVSEPRAIAQAILALLDDADRARRLGEHGKKLVAEKYNWDHDEAKLLGVFAQLEGACP